MVLSVLLRSMSGVLFRFWIMDSTMEFFCWRSVVSMWLGVSFGLVLVWVFFWAAVMVFCVFWVYFFGLRVMSAIFW